MSQSFKQADVFPLIYRLITDATDKNSAFIGHAELVDALLSVTEGIAIVGGAEVNNKLGLRGTASNMVAWFSQRYTKGANEFGALLERQKLGTTWAYRSMQSTRTVAIMPVLPLDVDLSAFEGIPKMVIHLRRERDPKLVKGKLENVQSTTGRLACECCGFEAKNSFPDLNSPIVEVHHRNMLSAQEGQTKTTLDDLCVLCPTCHRAIHRSGDISVEAFRLKYFSVGSSLGHATE